MAKHSRAFREVGFVQPDSRGRISLSQKGVIKVGGHKADGYKQLVNDEGEILLVPVAHIPLRELWLFENPEALARVQAGLADLSAGRLVDRGDFTQYLDDEDL